MTSAEHSLRTVRSRSLIVGAAGVVVWTAGWALAAINQDAELLRQVFFSYLFAFVFSLSIPLGSLALWLLHNQTGGAWGLALRRALEAGSRTLYAMPLLFLPLVFGLNELYLWADPSRVHEPHLLELLHRKEPYLNVPFFLVRSGVYFAVWIGCTAWLSARTTTLDRAPDAALAKGMQAFSGPGLVLWGLTVTFAAIDWLMSLEPDWYSTIFGMLVAAGQVVPALALAIAVSVWCARGTETVPADVWNDLGNLLLAVVMVCTYLSFSQFLLIWSGNLPEEITWYLKRSQGGWQWVAILLAVGYFALPFVLLLSRANKRDPERLMQLSLILVAVTVVHYFWLVKPVHAAQQSDGASYGPLAVHLLDVAALLGIGGMTFAAFLWQLGRRPLSPPLEALTNEAVQHA